MSGQYTKMEQVLTDNLRFFCDVLQLSVTEMDSFASQVNSRLTDEANVSLGLHLRKLENLLCRLTVLEELIPKVLEQLQDLLSIEALPLKLTPQVQEESIYSSSQGLDSHELARQALSSAEHVSS
ncbi:MAG: hypothetical protein HY711_05385 [Candidatus Melainabacteria bacterium]|nr:hypothetical protein [Candidatus Melainabacteria bacterium]